MDAETEQKETLKEMQVKTTKIALIHCDVRLPSQILHRDIMSNDLAGLVARLEAVSVEGSLKGYT
jgi:hypothetical protein